MKIPTNANPGRGKVAAQFTEQQAPKSTHPSGTCPPLGCNNACGACGRRVWDNDEPNRRRARGQ